MSYKSPMDELIEILGLDSPEERGRWSLIAVLLLGLVHLGLAGYKLYVALPGLGDLATTLGQTGDLQTLWVPMRVTVPLWLTILGILAGVTCGLLLLARRGWWWAIVLTCVSLLGAYITPPLLVLSVPIPGITILILRGDITRALFKKPPLPRWVAKYKWTLDPDGPLFIVAWLHLLLGILLLAPASVAALLLGISAMKAAGHADISFGTKGLMILSCICCYGLAVGCVYLNIGRKLGWYGCYFQCRLWAKAQMVLVPGLGTLLGLVTLLSLYRPGVRGQFPAMEGAR